LIAHTSSLLTIANYALLVALLKVTLKTQKYLERSIFMLAQGPVFELRIYSTILAKGESLQQQIALLIHKLSALMLSIPVSTPERLSCV
jgi:hypothetical protein